MGNIDITSLQEKVELAAKTLRESEEELERLSSSKSKPASGYISNVLNLFNRGKRENSIASHELQVHVNRLNKIHAEIELALFVLELQLNYQATIQQEFEDLQVTPQESDPDIAFQPLRAAFANDDLYPRLKNLLDEQQVAFNQIEVLKTYHSEDNLREINRLREDKLKLESQKESIEKRYQSQKNLYQQQEIVIQEIKLKILDNYLDTSERMVAYFTQHQDDSLIPTIQGFLKDIESKLSTFQQLSINPNAVTKENFDKFSQNCNILQEILRKKQHLQVRQELILQYDAFIIEANSKMRQILEKNPVNAQELKDLHTAVVEQFQNLVTKARYFRDALNVYNNKKDELLELRSKLLLEYHHQATQKVMADYKDFIEKTRARIHQISPESSLDQNTISAEINQNLDHLKLPKDSMLKQEDGSMLSLMEIKELRGKLLELRDKELPTKLLDLRISIFTERYCKQDGLFDQYLQERAAKFGLRDMFRNLGACILNIRCFEPNKQEKRKDYLEILKATMETFKDGPNEESYQALEKTIKEGLTYFPKTKRANSIHALLTTLKNELEIVASSPTLSESKPTL